MMGHGWRLLKGRLLPDAVEELLWSSHQPLIQARPPGSAPTFVSTLTTYPIMANIALARAYQQSFESHPYYTLALTNGALNALGDAVAQVTQRLVGVSVLLFR